MCINHDLIPPVRRWSKWFYSYAHIPGPWCCFVRGICVIYQTGAVYEMDQGASDIPALFWNQLLLGFMGKVVSPSSALCMNWWCCNKNYRIHKKQSVDQLPSLEKSVSSVCVVHVLWKKSYITSKSTNVSCLF